MRGARALVAVSVVALLLGGLDLVARSVVEGRMERRVGIEVEGASSVEVAIDSFPFLPRLLWAGSMAAVKVRAAQVPTRAVDLTAVKLDLRGVKLDRDALFSGETRLEDIDRGTMSVELDSASLSRALRVPVTVGGGQVRATVGRGQVTARPETGRDGSLVLRVGSLALRVPLSRTRLLSCAATRVEVVADRVRASCELDGVPPALERAVR